MSPFSTIVFVPIQLYFDVQALKKLVYVGKDYFFLYVYELIKAMPIQRRYLISPLTPFRYRR
jgi:hypothetical protein